MAGADKSSAGGEEMVRRGSTAESDGGMSDGSLCYSDAEDGSWHQSPFNSDEGGGSRSYEDDYRLSNSNPSDLEIRGVSEPHHRKSSSSSSSSCRTSNCSVEVDLESGVTEMKVHLARVEKDCRICHLTLEPGNSESGIAIELGCSCKGDLAAAHKHCAEAWFKIKGNKTCEICGSVARNVVNANDPEQLELNETNDVTTAPTPPAETRSFWHGHRFLNFLLACMVFAFVISWLFHFNVPS